MPISLKQLATEIVSSLAESSGNKRFDDLKEISLIVFEIYSDEDETILDDIENSKDYADLYTVLEKRGFLEQFEECIDYYFENKMPKRSGRVPIEPEHPDRSKYIKST